jgi:hypothetical protein
MIADTAWLRWRHRHRRKSALQRDWESGDPVRIARVEKIAAAIRAEMAAEAGDDQPRR